MLSPHDPAGVAAAVALYAEKLRRTRRPDECITVSVADVLDAIGLASARRSAPLDALISAVLEVLGFEAGTRGRNPVTGAPNRVLRLARERHLSAAGASQLSAVPAMARPTSTAQALRCHTRPTNDNTQRRLAAEKRVSSGTVTT
ncbi:MAG: hypothetical protein Q8K45_19390 [Rubrivivax sp.]|nr:hypothetical protein [Rubrivivax sp.]